MSTRNFRLPVFQVADVYHIGTLDPAARGERGPSLEGASLSVSRSPHAWRSIAKLGSLPLQRLRKPGALFVDGRGLLPGSVGHAHVTNWAIAQGLARQAMVWCSWTFDEEVAKAENDEVMGWTYTTHETQAEALANQVDEDSPLVRGGPSGAAVEERELFVGTAAMNARMLRNDLLLGDAYPYALMAWAEDTVPEVEGVWWKDLYLPEIYSAPRGAILPSRLAAWSAQECDWPVDDDLRNPSRILLEPKQLLRVAPAPMRMM